MTRPKRNCLWCASCVQIDEGWYHCAVNNVEFNHSKASAQRRCKSYSESWCRADNLNDVADGHIDERELALYERRMRGDWS